MGGYAWVTLATNDAYSLGALVLAHSLRRVGSKYEMAILITPGVKQEMRDKLAGVFRVVQEVNVLDSNDKANLALLKRPELGVTFTKLHCWRLTQFDKCVFLDADTLVVRNCDELFEREELSAAPDVGWPDCFNSGVFVFKPSEETFASILKLATEKGSFDGGDQGVLNLYFSDWAHKDISKHLPFVYNMCSTAVYSYLPAFKQFGENVRIIHFIGDTKPWLQYFDTVTGIVRPPPNNAHLQPLLQMWWNIFCDHVYTQLSSSMDPSNPASNWHDSVSPPTQSHHPDVEKPTDFSEFSDPWLEYSRETDPFIQPDVQTFEPAHPEQYYSSSEPPDVEHVSESVTEQFVVLDSSHLRIDFEPSESHSANAEVETETDEKSQDDFEYDSCDFSSNETRVISESISSDARDVSPINSPTQNPHCSFLFQSLETNSSYFESLPQSEHGGLAGALATMTLGEPRTSEQNALEEHMRKQSWEYGNIDYLGRDSFDNIWKKIGETISEKPDPIAEEPAVKEASSKVLEQESSKSVETQPATTAAEETPIGSGQQVQLEPTTQSTEPVLQSSPVKPSTPQQESQLPLVPATLLESNESQSTVCPIATGPSAEEIKSVPSEVSKDLFEPLSYALTPAELENQLASTPVGQPAEEKKIEPKLPAAPSKSLDEQNQASCPVKPVTEVSHTAILVQQAVPTPEAQISIEQIPQSPTEPQKVVSKTEIQLVPSTPLVPDSLTPEVQSPAQVEPAATVVAAESAVPLQVAESVLHTELKESGEALSSTVAPIQESAAAISESTILESVPAPTIEQNISAIQIPAPSNGFVEPSTLTAFSASVVDTPEQETSPLVVPPAIPQVSSAEPPKVGASSTVTAQSPVEPSAQEVPNLEGSQPKSEIVAAPESEVAHPVQTSVAPVEQEVVQEKSEQVCEGRKLELKITQSSEPEPKLEIPATPTVTGPTPPISPPASAESEGPQEESKTSPEEKKKKITSKGSIEGEEGETSKKTVKKVVKKVVKKKDSTEEAGEGSTTKKTTKTVKKVSKSPQQSLEADDSIPQTPPPASSEAPVAPKRKAKSTKTTVDKKTEDPK